MAAAFALRDDLFARAVARADGVDPWLVVVAGWLPAAAALTLLGTLFLRRERSRGIGVPAAAGLVLLLVALPALVVVADRWPDADRQVLEDSVAGRALLAGTMAGWAGLLTGGLAASRSGRRGDGGRSPGLFLATAGGCLAALALALATR